MHETLRVPAEWDDLPRVGLVFAVDAAFDRLEWFGRGPLESYPDRRSSSIVGRHRSTAADQYHPYAVPQEHGAHAETRWFALTDHAGQGVRCTMPDPVSFAARRHTDEALTTATTLAELHTADHVDVHIDAAVRGLGTAACGPDTLAPYLLGAGTYRWVWVLTPV
jgi:beta-galactosidase